MGEKTWNFAKVFKNLIRYTNLKIILLVRSLKYNECEYLYVDEIPLKQNYIFRQKVLDDKSKH